VLNTNKKTGAKNTNIGPAILLPPTVTTCLTLPKYVEYE
jgi:hypothetical protein